MKLDELTQVRENGYFGTPFRKPFGLDATNDHEHRLPERIFIYTFGQFACSAGLAVLILIDGAATEDTVKVAVLFLSMPFATGLCFGFIAECFEVRAWWDKHKATYNPRPAPIKQDILVGQPRAMPNSASWRRGVRPPEEFIRWCKTYSDKNGRMPSEVAAREAWEGLATNEWLDVLAVEKISIGRDSRAAGGQANLPGAWNGEISLEDALAKFEY